MKRFLVPGAILLIFFSCGKTPSRKGDTFAAFRQRFIDAYWLVNPLTATNVGYHQYDDLLPAYDDATRKREQAFAQAYLDTLGTFEKTGLDPLDRVDVALMQNTLRSMQFYADTFKAWQWDPSTYNVAGAFADIVNARNLTNDEKYKSIIARLRLVPAYYEAAKKNISNPTEVHTVLAIEQSEGTVSYLQNELEDFCASTSIHHDTLLRASLLHKATDAVEDYRAFLQKLLPGSRKDFRIGKALYGRKFFFDIQSASSAEQVFRKAMQRKSELHTAMFSITRKLWDKYFRTAMPADTLKAIRMLVDKVSLKHVQRDSFLSSIEKQIPELTAFVKEKDLLYLDPSKPLKVRRTPAYMDGVAGASISAPGPYDNEAETYYNVSTLEKMPAREAESYLREYNHYVLQILNIHEAVPGHYAQLVYANKAPSLVKTIFGNGAMIEGWAVYAERMMLENGYGNNEPEMWLMYSKWHLRTVCNTILDYNVHVNGWNEQQALHLLVDEAFQQEAEARGKWRRVSVSQVQLCSYFSGYSEIFELREELRKQPGFKLRAFHEQFLGYGSAPVRSIRQMMLEETAKKN